MKRRMTCFALALCCFLSGCSWLEGTYVSISPHRAQAQNAQQEAVSASSYRQLCDALENMIDTGTENSVINVSGYDQNFVDRGMEMAARYATSSYPMGAYAVEELHYEVGTNSGKPAIAITISYRHSRAEIRKIPHVKDMEEALPYMEEALADCESGIVMLIDSYAPVDFSQLVEDFAAQNPQIVMETPQVTAGVYPEGIGTRVVEFTFTYHTSRDTLRQMQTQVEPVFNSAALYVSGDAEDSRKLAQLYAFLMERFDYQLETSITPSYSLLRHGVGDSRAFALVYAAMCRQAGLECLTVSGTRSGEPWCWNVVKDGEHYFHIDLLRCSAEGGFREYTDPEMGGYVWDYSAYPECPALLAPEPDPETDVTEEPDPQDPTEETEGKTEEETTESTEATEATEVPEEPEETTEPGNVDSYR